MSFEKKIILNTWALNSLALALILAYSLLSTLVPIMDAFKVLQFIIPLFILCLFIVGPVVDHFAYKKISDRLIVFEKGNSDAKERTNLLICLHKQPVICMFITTVFFLISSILTYCYMLVTLKLDFATIVSLFVEWLCGSFFAGLIGYRFRRKLCDEYSYRIVKEGVNEEYIKAKKNFGQGLKQQMTTTILVPVILVTIVTVILYALTLPSLTLPPENIQTNGRRIHAFFLISMSRLWVYRIICTTFFNSIIISGLIISFYHNFSSKNLKSIQGLKSINKNNTSLSDTVSQDALTSDLYDELSYNIYLIDSLIKKYKKMFFNSLEIGKMITQSSASLKGISAETEQTAASQSLQTGDIISKMEDNKKMSLNIDQSANSVADAAKQTALNISTASSIMQQNIENMQKVADSNENTMENIRNLNQKINSIWEIINMINSIAEQTKIIAFNTELESSKILGEDKHFLNVALETRRLANNIADSTKEIQNFIRNIEDTEAELMKYSVSNTDEITKGLDSSYSIQSIFAVINDLSITNNYSAQEIKELIQNQSTAFDQIQQTLLQIGSGIRNFSISANSLVQASTNLNMTAEKLGKLAYGESI